MNINLFSQVSLTKGDFSKPLLKSPLGRKAIALEGQMTFRSRLNNDFLSCNFLASSYGFIFPYVFFIFAKKFLFHHITDINR